ncbi:hypothetical protein FB451DRAFT_1173652 [Mycena latifolia]|nr:hypothetical protein FB451DRAFT_1173652 [Mycena latifolia]
MGGKIHQVLALLRCTPKFKATLRASRPSFLSKLREVLDLKVDRRVGYFTQECNDPGTPPGFPPPQPTNLNGGGYGPVRSPVRLAPASFRCPYTALRCRTSPYASFPTCILTPTDSYGLWCTTYHTHSPVCPFRLRLRVRNEIAPWHVHTNAGRAALFGIPRRVVHTGTRTAARPTPPHAPHQPPIGRRACPGQTVKARRRETEQQLNRTSNIYLNLGARAGDSQRREDSKTLRGRVSESRSSSSSVTYLQINSPKIASRQSVQNEPAGAYITFESAAKVTADMGRKRKHAPKLCPEDAELVVTVVALVVDQSEDVQRIVRARRREEAEARQRK